eukprot:5105542-Lingulodinium_polyedra.AAC.1
MRAEALERLEAVFAEWEELARQELLAVLGAIERDAPPGDGSAHAAPHDAPGAGLPQGQLGSCPAAQ